MSKVTICLLTYNRFEYAERTLRSILDNIMHDGPISVHIADDGSPGDYRDKLADIAGGYAKVQGVTVTNANRSGYGANFNLATQVIHEFSDWIIPLEDDWDCPAILNIDNFIADMECSGRFDCVRLGYLSFTQALYGEVVNVGNKYLLLDPKSAEPHIWSGHPRIESVARQRRIGPWVEGLSPGATEFAVAHWAESRQGVAWPMCYDPVVGFFQHIGTIRSTDV